MEFSAKTGRKESKPSDRPTSRGNAGKGSVQKDYEMDSIDYNWRIIRPVVALIKSFASVRTACRPVRFLVAANGAFHDTIHLQDKKSIQDWQDQLPKASGRALFREDLADCTLQRP
jgi:hypothetical protein